jgi:hypothetical protein
MVIEQKEKLYLNYILYNLKDAQIAQPLFPLEMASIHFIPITLRIIMWGANKIDQFHSQNDLNTLNLFYSERKEKDAEMHSIHQWILYHMIG